MGVEQETGAGNHMEGRRAGKSGLILPLILSLQLGVGYLSAWGLFTNCPLRRLDLKVSKVPLSWKVTPPLFFLKWDKVQDWPGREEAEGN